MTDCCSRQVLCFHGSGSSASGVYGPVPEEAAIPGTEGYQCSARQAGGSCLSGRLQMSKAPTSPIQYLLARPQFVPPFLQALVMALIQGLQLLGFMFYQQVTLFILE